MSLFSKAVKNHWEKTVWTVDTGKRVSSGAQASVGTWPKEPREHGYTEHMTLPFNSAPGTQNPQFSDQITPNSIPGPLSQMWKSE